MFQYQDIVTNVRNIRAANDVIIPLTRITQIERAKDIHLYHLIWMLHDKPFVSSCFGLTLEDIKPVSL